MADFKRWPSLEPTNKFKSCSPFPFCLSRAQNGHRAVLFQWAVCVFRSVPFRSVLFHFIPFRFVSACCRRRDSFISCPLCCCSVAKSNRDRIRNNSDESEQKRTTLSLAFVGRTFVGSLTGNRATFLEAHFVAVLLFVATFDIAVSVRIIVIIMEARLRQTIGGGRNWSKTGSAVKEEQFASYGVWIAFVGQAYKGRRRRRRQLAGRKNEEGDIDSSSCLARANKQTWTRKQDSKRTVRIHRQELAAFHHPAGLLFGLSLSSQCLSPSILSSAFHLEGLWKMKMRERARKDYCFLSSSCSFFVFLSPPGREDKSTIIRPCHWSTLSRAASFFSSL